jgi:hypothetical protein
VGQSLPGERRASARRPGNWAIEWDDHDGLAFDAYATDLRAPYVQNVTTAEATILWRVNPPGDSAALVRPCRVLVPGAPLALRVAGAGYLGYVEREVGINLGWSAQPWAQWEVRLKANANAEAGTDADALAHGVTVALYNRAASDYLVHARRGRGVDLAWHGDTPKRTPLEWRLTGALPVVGLSNRRKRGVGLLVHQERRHGVNLGWGAPTEAPNVTLETLHLAATLELAPGDTPLARGRRFTTDDGTIRVSEVSWTYLYRAGVGPGAGLGPDLPNQRLRVLHHRPVLQCEARITGLRPGRRYHYRVRTDGRDPGAPAGTAAASLLLADDVTFRTAPGPSRTASVRWLAMGDLGPGKRKPSYVYDVCDLFSAVARRHDAQLWLPLGDLDNDTNGHPNAVDPFLLDVFNAHRPPGSPRTTSADPRQARDTRVAAFANPTHHGLLGGLPAFPTFGNHDICLQNGGSAARFRRAYLGTWVLPGAAEGWCPAARDFNAAGRGYFYTFRWGRVIFISLGLPQLKGCRVSASEDWHHAWGRRQETALVRLLSALQSAARQPDVWLVAYFHDHHCAIDPPGRAPFPRLLLQHGVDLALAGHLHHFEAHDLVDGDRHLRALVVGTGGYGDPDPGDHCRRPGFVLLDVTGDTLRYWKYDTHHCAAADPTDPDPYREGTPLGREARHWHLRECCQMRKTGLSAHEIVDERDLRVPVQLNNPPALI